jgi:pimeloyl-ACP methyl ester carboxylesterase
LATYVLVHGGWCYRKVARIIRSAGPDVYTSTMTGVGERAHLLLPDIDLDFHINDIVKVLEYEDLRDVILVGHSYGGMVITGVADRATDRIGHLVYLDAATPINGESLADISPEQMVEARNEGQVIDGVEVVLGPGTEPIPNHGVTDHDLAWMTPKLTPHPYKCFERLTNEAALWAIPQTHIVCTATLPYRDPSPDGEGQRGVPALGHRHGARPHDHRAQGGRRPAPGPAGTVRLSTGGRIR